MIDPIKNVLVDTPNRYFGGDFFGKNGWPELSWKDYSLDTIMIPDRSEPDTDTKWALSYRFTLMADTYSVNFEGW